MTTTPIETSPKTYDSERLSADAREHLWMHFTRMSSYENAPVPTIVRGEGTYIYDDHGKRYIDGLSGLFVVNAGHGRHERQQCRGCRLDQDRRPATRPIVRPTSLHPP